MPTNVGFLDRAIRALLGVCLIAFALFAPPEIGWRWIGWIGVVPLLTAAFATCPLYTLLGLSTCPRSAAR